MNKPVDSLLEFTITGLVPEIETSDKNKLMYSDEFVAIDVMAIKCVLLSITKTGDVYTINTARKTELEEQRKELYKKKQQIVYDFVKNHFKTCSLYQWLENHNITRYTLDINCDSFMIDIGPFMKLIFEDPKDAMLFKLAWFKT